MEGTFLSRGGKIEKAGTGSCITLYLYYRVFPLDGVAQRGGQDASLSEFRIL